MVSCGMATSWQAGSVPGGRHWQLRPHQPDDPTSLQEEQDTAFSPEGNRLQMFKFQITPTSEGTNQPQAYLQRKEHLQTHSTRPPLPWYPNQTETIQKKKTTGQYHWWTQMRKSSTKFQQTESSNTSKSSYTMTKLGLFQGCQYSSIYANQSMWYTILTNWKIKTT